MDNLSLIEASEFNTYIDDIFTIQIDPVSCTCVLPKLNPKTNPYKINDELSSKRTYHASVVWDMYIVMMASDKASPVYPMFDAIFYAALYNLRRTEFALIDLQLHYKCIGFIPLNKPALYEFAFIIFDTRVYIAKIIGSTFEKYVMINQHAPLSKMISFCDNQIHAVHRLLDEIADLPPNINEIAKRLSLCTKNMNKVMKPIPKLSLHKK